MFLGLGKESTCELNGRPSAKARRNRHTKYGTQQVRKRSMVKNRTWYILVILRAMKGEVELEVEVEVGVRGTACRMVSNTARLLPKNTSRGNMKPAIVSVTNSPMSNCPLSWHCKGGPVEVRGRQDGGHQPQEATGQRHGPVGASQSSPHGPQQAQASLQGHGAEEESGGVQPQTSQEHDQVAEDASEWPAVVVSDVAQHQGRAQEQHQVGQGQVQDINTEAAGSARLLAAASAHQVATMLHSESPNHQPVQRNAHLEEPRGPVQDDWPRNTRTRKMSRVAAIWTPRTASTCHGLLEVFELVGNRHSYIS
ncbi:hypothetical protein EYF80_022514 [Liparis tanakae]|uniref:Uncharacterized protein n=1 Tax=Liparis tanakae TaxID=230148 RepID=A0A4Z2HPS9_9TELE|nr:hypothetical protein EYF80_022514 [Liparis tanakae]